MRSKGWRILTLAYPLIGVITLMVGSWFTPPRMIFWMYLWMIPIFGIGGLAFLIHDHVQHRRRLRRSLKTRAARFVFGDRVVILEGERWGPTRPATVGRPPQAVLDDTGPWVNGIAQAHGDQIYFWVYLDEPYTTPDGETISGAGILDRDLYKAEPHEVIASAITLARSTNDDGAPTRH